LPFGADNSAIEITLYHAEGTMDNFQKEIDDRANLTLSNRFELLLSAWAQRHRATPRSCTVSTSLSCGKSSRCRASPAPPAIKPPLMGMVNIRDQIIPVIDLAAVAGCTPATG
jgi:two-component system chemotaxis response regulator CheV